MLIQINFQPTFIDMFLLQSILSIEAQILNLNPKQAIVARLNSLLAGRNLGQDQAHIW